MKQKLRIGIIGTGVGLRTHYPGFDRTNKVEFVGLVGSNEERAKEFAKKYNFKKVFKNYQDLIESDEIDFVCITSPNTYHADEIILAINNDKHILAEKPLASSIDEINNILSYGNTKSKLHLINHQLRFNPYIVAVKEIIDNGKIGRPYFVKIHQQSIGFSDKNAKWSWSFDEMQGGGVRLAMGSHLIDIINFWLNGVTPLLVKGNMDSVIEERVDNENRIRKVYASSFFSSDISFENNLNVQISATAAAFSNPRFDFSIFGTEGELHFDLQNKLTASFINNRGSIRKVNVSNVTEEERDNKVSIFSGSFVYYANEIMKYFSNKDSSIKTAAKFEDAIYTQIILDAILKSSLEGETIKIKDIYNCNSKI